MRGLVQAPAPRAGFCRRQWGRTGIAWIPRAGRSRPHAPFRRRENRGSDQIVLGERKAMVEVLSICSTPARAMRSTSGASCGARSNFDWRTSILSPRPRWLGKVRRQRRTSTLVWVAFRRKRFAGNGKAGCADALREFETTVQADGAVISSLNWAFSLADQSMGMPGWHPSGTNSE